MKTIPACLVFIGVLSFHRTFAQQLVGTISSPNPISNLQIATWGDTTLLTYYTSNASVLALKTQIVFPNGSIKDLDLPLLKEKALFGFVSERAHVALYYIDKIKGESYIKALMFDKQSLDLEEAPTSYRIQNDLISVFIQGDLHVMQQSNKGNRLTLVRLRGLTPASEENYEIQSRLNTKSTAVIYRKNQISPAEAAADNKVYISPEELVIVREQPAHDRAASVIANITIINRESGRISNHAIFGTGHSSFSTFYYRGYLYKVLKNKGFEISIYQGETLIKYFKIDKEASFSHDSAYVRVGRDRNVYGDRTVWDAMDNMGGAFIAVEDSDSMNVTIKLGTHRVLPGGAPIPVVGPLAVAAVLATVRTLSMALSDANSFDHYFYLKGNVQQGFTYAHPSGTLTEQIDHFEMIRPGETNRYSYKGYGVGDNYIMALYKKVNVGQVEIFKFIPDKSGQ